MNDLGKYQLSKIKVSGYKSIKNCEIDLMRMNVIIGSNGAGKSNFISMFSFLVNVLERRLALGVNSSGGASSILFGGRKATKRIKMEFGSSWGDYSFELIPTDDDRLIFDKEDYSINGSIKKLNGGYSESLIVLESAQENSAFAGFFLHATTWQVHHFQDTGRDSVIKQTQNISDNVELRHDAGNLAAFLYMLKNDFKSSYKEIVNTIKLIAPYFDDFVLIPNAGNNEQIILRWKQVGSESIFNASQLSDGTLRFICLATLLLQPEKYRPSVIIIDEPELGLHPYAITILAELIQQASGKNQVIVSTQSVEFLNEFDVADIIVVDRDKDSSVLKRLDEESLKGWLEDYTLGELWNKNILGGRLSR